MTKVGTKFFHVLVITAPDGTVTTKWFCDAEYTIPAIDHPHTTNKWCCMKVNTEDRIPHYQWQDAIC